MTAKAFLLKYYFSLLCRGSLCFTFVAIDETDVNNNFVVCIRENDAREMAFRSRRRGVWL